MLRSYKHRLYPSRSQAEALNGMLGAFCELYNAGLQQRLEAYHRQRKSLRYADQANELKAVRLADERLAGYSYSDEQQILRRLDKAFAAFFRRLKTKAKAGFPRFRAKSWFDSAEFRVADGLTVRNSKRIGIVGIPAEIKVKWHRPLPADAKLGAAVISRSCAKWFVCFQIELPDAEPVDRTSAPVGIDMGLTSIVALSTGEMVATPQYVSKGAKRLRRLQRAVARRRRHSERQRKAKRAVARLDSRVANQRRDFSHKLSRRLVDRFSDIAMEDLNIVDLASSPRAKPTIFRSFNAIVEK